VEQVAQRIEDGRYREVESAVTAIEGSRQVREQARELVAADKHMHVSYETLRLTVEFFGDLNQAILTRLTTERPSPAQLSNIMFTNAVMIYEIADFVIDYVQNFVMDNPHEELHRAAAGRAEQGRRDEAALEQELDNEAILPGARESMREEARMRKAAWDELDRQWERYLEEIRGLYALVDEVKRTVPTLRAIRTNARNQINVLQEAAMLRVLTMNSTSMRGAVEAVQSLRLAPLSSERVRVLVGAVD